LKKFVLVNGYVSMDNSQLYIDINNLKKDVKDRGGFLAVFLAFIGISVYRNLKDEDYFEIVFHYIDFGFRILGLVVIILFFWYLIFKKKSKRNLTINDIDLIEIDKDEFETELTLRFSNKKEIELNFRNLENQLEPFLESIKKRNSRVKIQYS